MSLSPSGCSGALGSTSGGQKLRRRWWETLWDFQPKGQGHMGISVVMADPQVSMVVSILKRYHFRWFGILQFGKPPQNFKNMYFSLQCLAPLKIGSIHFGVPCWNGILGRWDYTSLRAVMITLDYNYIGDDHPWTGNPYQPTNQPTSINEWRCGFGTLLNLRKGQSISPPR